MGKPCIRVCDRKHSKDKAVLLGAMQKGRFRREGVKQSEEWGCAASLGQKAV